MHEELFRLLDNAIISMTRLDEAMLSTDFVNMSEEDKNKVKEMLLVLGDMTGVS